MAQKKDKDTALEGKSKPQINPLKGMVFSALFAAFTAAIAPVKIPLGFTPVPITLQTLAVLLSGAVLGPYYGALSMILYIAVGALGLPVFAGGSSGIGVLFGPTGGYLFSYPIAAFVIGWAVQVKKSNWIKYGSLAILTLLLLIIYVDLFFKLGIMELTTKMPDTKRYLVAGASLIAILILGFAGYYLVRSKNVSINTILAMVVGTLIIYLLGSLQGKLVTSLPWPAIFTGWVLPFLIGDTIKLLIAAYISTNLELEKYLK